MFALQHWKQYEGNENYCYLSNRGQGRYKLFINVIYVSKVRKYVSAALLLSRKVLAFFSQTF